MAKPFNIEAFKAWLIERGAIVDPPTNEWEVIRVRTIDGPFVAYRNAKGVQKWPGGLMEIKQAFINGEQIPLSPSLASRKKLRHLINDLSARDGLWCWFCEVGFLTPDSTEITIEHLCPKAHGGPNHVSNLVLACKRCNSEAGNLSIAEKVRMRDDRRAPVCTPIKARGAA